MKKISLITLSVATALSGMAQVSVVKDAERALKGTSPDHGAIRTMIKPTLSNPETKDNAQAWYVAGANEFKSYDDLYGKRAIGKEVDQKAMARTLIDGYNYFMTAFPLDSVVNEKGKVKTKYSKDMAKTITGHANDFDAAARMLWEAKDFDGAYTAWGIFLDLPGNASLGKDAPSVLPDTIAADLRYYQGLAAWQADRLNDALETLYTAKNQGYNKKDIYDYAISIAAQLHRNDTVYALAAEALPLYGKEDPKFIGLVINSYIDKKDYANAQTMLEKAIADDPTNAQLFDALGILYESQKTDDMAADVAADLDKKAFESYKKAVEVDPSFARGNFDLGRKLSDQAFVISENASNMSQAEYNKIKEEQIFPLFREASTYFEKAYELDADNMGDALRYLRNIYYNLNDDANLKRVEALL